MPWSEAYRYISGPIELRIIEPQAMNDLPETILQFGAGNFLRSFADTFVDEANRAGQNVGSVVVVQSTESRRAELINAQKGRYHVAVRGLVDGQPVDEVQVVESIGRALVANTQWEQVLEAGCGADLKWIISNTTEKGYLLAENDGPDDAPPRAFPPKLLTVLLHRFRSGGSPVTIIPCELFDRNADMLCEILHKLAKEWKLEAAFVTWLVEGCAWVNNLVDRIVTTAPDDHRLRSKDALLTVAEPFCLWVLEKKPGATYILDHPAIRIEEDVRSYYLRKVRILNGLHSALVEKAVPQGIETVREAVEHPEIGTWLEQLLYEEIVPTLQDQVDAPAEFAQQTLERFKNPFIEHRLEAIALHHESKVKVRLIPTYVEFSAKFGRPPSLLSDLLKEFI